MFSKTSSISPESFLLTCNRVNEKKKHGPKWFCVLHGVSVYSFTEGGGVCVPYKFVFTGRLEISTVTKVVYFPWVIYKFLLCVASKRLLKEKEDLW